MIARLVVVLLALAATGCLAPPLAPLDGELDTAQLAADEQYLWKKSREIQYAVESSGLLFEEATLDRYLTQVLQRVTPSELLAAGVEPRVQVISDVRIHGYSFANGVIYLHTALLSRMQNETQLATVFTRELAHVIHRHSLRLERDKKIQADTMAWLGVAASVSDAGKGAKQLAQAFAVSSAIGFPHMLETAADREGLRLLRAAGYEVAGAPRFFQNTLDYLAEIHTQGPLAWAPFTPPPQMTLRIAGYQSLIDTEFKEPAEIRPPIADPATFRRNVHAATRRQAVLELAAGLFVSAEATARLATESNARDPEAWLLLGDALQGQRSKPLAGRALPSIRDVRQAYSEALEIDPRHPSATRELGLSHYRKTSRYRSPESTREAITLLRRYLTIAPDAQDADYIEGYLTELEAAASH